MIWFHFMLSTQIRICEKGKVCDSIQNSSWPCSKPQSNLLKYTDSNRMDTITIGMMSHLSASLPVSSLLADPCTVHMCRYVGICSMQRCLQDEIFGSIWFLKPHLVYPWSYCWQTQIYFCISHCEGRYHSHIYTHVHTCTYITYMYAHVCVCVCMCTNSD